ncbi:MAG: hypothetical protein HC765_11700 [Brachymonas sp.]|nr:hypothetical protein [Brachymonas sp.]
MADALRQQLHVSKKPVFAYVSPHAPHVLPVLMASGIPAFTEAEHCAVALEALWKQSQRSTSSQIHSPSSPKQERTVNAAEVMSYTGSLNEYQAKQLFARFGIPCVREHILTHDAQTQSENLDFNGPVVLKILSDTIDA